MPIRNNVTRLLDARGIPYRQLEFSPEVRSAPEVARAVNLPLEQVYKTLVVLGEHGRVLLVLLGGDRELDLRRLARALGEKKLHMASQRQAEQLTGLQVGGISPLALLNRGFEVYIDELVELLDHVCISGGRRGLNLLLAVPDLLALTGARRVDLG